MNNNVYDFDGWKKSDLFLTGLSAGTSPASAEKDHHSQDKSEVVPVAAVVHLIHIDLVTEQGNDKGEKRDESVPQSSPETCHLSFLIFGIFHLIGPSCA
jgi:hypothetical protein